METHNMKKLPIPINPPPRRYDRKTGLAILTIYTASGLISFAVIMILYNILC